MKAKVLLGTYNALKDLSPGTLFRTVKDGRLGMTMMLYGGSALHFWFETGEDNNMAFPTASSSYADEPVEILKAVELRN